MGDALRKLMQDPAVYNARLQITEMQFNSEIKNILDTMPEPYQTYLRKVKKFKAVYPPADLEKFRMPEGIMNAINDVKTKMMQLKIGGLKEEYGFSSGIKFDLGTVIQAIASGKGLTSRDRPFIKVRSDIEHAVTLLVDFSSSMEVYEKEIRESVFIFSEVLDKLQLTFSVFGFSDKFWIIKDFDDKWNLEAKARLFSLKPSGMSPAGIAIDVAGSMTRKVSDSGKIMFVLTDGFFDNRIQVKLAVKEIQKGGIAIIGISTFADMSDVFPICMVETENLNQVWSQDSFMRIYSREFHSD